MTSPDELLTPPQIFRLYEAGQIDREELHRRMARLHERYFREIEEEFGNPLMARFHALLNRRAANRLLREHGERAVREVMMALSEVPGFPPALSLWNARHADVPLSCMLRERAEPIFRILEMEVLMSRVVVAVHYGALKGKGAIKETLVFRRSRQGALELSRRGDVGLDS